MAQAFKGFSRLSIFPVTTNTTAAYTVGTKTAISGAVSFTKSPETSEWKIPADDGIFDSGSDWLGEKFTLTLAQCPLELRQYFEGGEYNATSKVYKKFSTSQAPELAISFRVLLSDGKSLMVQIFSLKCSSYKADYKTKGESGDISNVVIEGLIKNRVKDNQVSEEKVTVTDADLTWLDAISLPA